jgi:ABC-2 type transport system permease protein
MFRETYYIYLRNLKVWLAQPATLLPALFITAFIFIVFGSTFGEVVSLPGFPADDYMAFLVPMIIVQAMVFSGGDAGFNILTDMLSGYMDKLLLAPIQRISILLGVLLLAGTRGLVQAVLILALALAFGVSFETGVPGVALLMVMSILFGVAWSCLGIIIALKTRSVTATQSSFVLFFPAIFLTTSFMPKEFLADWFQVAVTINPVNYVLEALRVLVIQGWEWDVLLPGLAVLLVMTVGLVGVSTWLYRQSTA